MIEFLSLVAHILVSPFKTRARLEAEIILLRHQVIVVFGDAHLRRILADYAGYYNELRTHLSLDKDSPAHRPIQRFGQLATRPSLGGLHHQYGRI